MEPSICSVSARVRLHSPFVPEPYCMYTREACIKTKSGCDSKPGNKVAPISVERLVLCGAASPDRLAQRSIVLQATWCSYLQSISSCNNHGIMFSTSTSRATRCAAVPRRGRYELYPLHSVPIYFIAFVNSKPSSMQLRAFRVDTRGD